MLALFFNPFWVNICIGCEIHLILVFCMCWPPHAKNWLIGKDSDAGRDWGQEEKGTTEDEMAGWHHWLDGREFEWTPGVGNGQAGLACCDSWGRKESDMTERLNWTDSIILASFAEKTILTESDCLGILLKISHKHINLFLGLRSIPLVCKSVPMPVPFCLDDYNFS